MSSSSGSCHQVLFSAWQARENNTLVSPLAKVFELDGLPLAKAFELDGTPLAKAFELDGTPLAKAFELDGTPLGRFSCDVFGINLLLFKFI